VKADSEDEMLAEYDFSDGVRGKFADWFTPEEREQFLRRRIEGSARTWHRFALERVRALEAALFAHTVLTAPALRVRETGPSATQPFRALVRLAAALDRGVPLDDGLRKRLRGLVEECHWAFRHGQEGAIGTPAERLAHKERLERLGREAEALVPAVNASIQAHLARSGLSEQEIEQKTEETAKLWLAA
jgi:hypothetical protein